MRRIVLVLSVAVVMAAMLVTSAMPAFAADVVLPPPPANQANCIGYGTSGYVVPGGDLGPNQRDAAQDPNQNFGPDRGDVASNCQNF